MEHQEIIKAFYHKALTVNTETSPTEVLGQILAPNFTSFGSKDSKTKDQLIGQLEFFWKVVPDLTWKPQQIVHEGDHFVVRSIASGTPHGNFMGLPVDGTRRFEIMTIDIHKIETGQVTVVHHLEDWGTAMEQLKSE